MLKTEKNLFPPNLFHVSSDTSVLSNTSPQTLVSSFTLSLIYYSQSGSKFFQFYFQKIYLEVNHILPSPLLPLGPSYNYLSPRLLQ